MSVARIEPGPGQESVWDYPRPPRIEPATKRAVVTFGGVVIADSVRCLRVLETSQAPAYYFPPSDMELMALADTDHTTFCEWKGLALHLDVRVGDRLVRSAAWSYRRPTPPFEAIAWFIAFYPGRVDGCTLDGEPVEPMAGGYYGGWITRDIVGPIKGGPSTSGW